MSKDAKKLTGSQNENWLLRCEQEKLKEKIESMEEEIKTLESAYEYVKKQSDSAFAELLEIKEKKQVVSMTAHKRLEKENAELLKFRKMYYAIVEDIRKMREDYHVYVEDLKKKFSNNNFQKHNARGAGRKRKLNDEDVLKLREDKGIKVEEIAEKLNVSIVTVKRALARARKQRKVSKLN